MLDLFLSDYEKKDIKKFQQDVKDMLVTLGSIRRQFIKVESEVLGKLNSIEAELIGYLNKLAKEKGMEDGEKWTFDPNTYGFVKQEPE